MTDIIDTAKALKIDLRATWPGVRWSVRTPPRGYFNVRVAWSDGPTRTTVEAWCHRWTHEHPDLGRWLNPVDTARDYTPAGYAAVIERIARDMPDLPIPRTAGGGLDIKAARALVWDKPIRVDRRFYGDPGRAYDVVAVVEFVASVHDFTAAPAGGRGMSGPEADAPGKGAPS